MKDFVLLAASFYLLKQDVASAVDSRDAAQRTTRIASPTAPQDYPFRDERRVCCIVLMLGLRGPG